MWRESRLSKLLRVRTNLEQDLPSGNQLLMRLESSEEERRVRSGTLRPRDRLKKTRRSVSERRRNWPSWRKRSRLLSLSRSSISAS